MPNLPPVRQEVIIEDGFRAPLQAIRKDVDKTKTTFQRLRAEIRRTGMAGSLKNLRSSIQGLKNSVGGVISGFKSMATTAGVVVGAGVGAAAVAIDRVTSSVDDLAKTSRSIDFPIDEFQRWKFVAQQSGVSAEDFSRSAGMLAKQVGYAKAGTGTLTTLFKKTDPVFLQKIKSTTSTAEAFSLLVEKLRETKDSTARAALATAAFGRTGMRMNNVAALSSSEIEILRSQMDEMGVVTTDQAKRAEEWIDMWSRVKGTVGGVLRDAILSVLPLLTDMADGFRRWVAANRELIRTRLIDWMKTGIGWIRRMGEWVGKRLPGWIVEASEAVKKFKDEVIPVFSEIWGFLKGLDWRKTGFYALGIYLAGPFMGILASLISIGPAIIGAVKAISATVKAAGLTMAVFSGPVGWVAAAVGALILLIIAFRQQMQPVIDAISGALSPLLMEVEVLLRSVADALGVTAENGGGLWGVIKDLVAWAARLVAPFVRFGVALLALPLRFVIFLVSEIIDGFREWWDQAKKLGVWLKQKFGPILAWLWEKIEPLVEGIKGIASKARGITSLLGITEYRKVEVKDGKVVEAGKSEPKTTPQPVGVGANFVPKLPEMVQNRAAQQAALPAMVALQGGAMRAEQQKIVVDFKNVPKGTRIESDGNMEINLEVGHAFGGF